MCVSSRFDKFTDMTRFFTAALTVLSLSFNAFADAPANFSVAKVIAKQKVFFEQAASDQGELYCGCKWEWIGKSGGRIDHRSCGYGAAKRG